jgi:hypothetical protein
MLIPDAVSFFQGDCLELNNKTSSILASFKRLTKLKCFSARSSLIIQMDANQFIVILLITSIKMFSYPFRHSQLVIQQ